MQIIRFLYPQRPEQAYQKKSATLQAEERPYGFQLIGTSNDGVDQPRWDHLCDGDRVLSLDELSRVLPSWIYNQVYAGAKNSTPPASGVVLRAPGEYAYR